MTDFPNNWMWSEACEMLARAERLHRDFFRPTRSAGQLPSWEPPDDVLETDAAVMSTGSARPLEDAYRISQHDLVTWVSSLTGLDELDAYQLVSQAGEAPVGNVCDTNYTMVAKIAKQYLGGGTAYDGVHAQLRQIAAVL